MRNLLKVILALGQFSNDYMILVNDHFKIVWLNKQLAEKGFKVKKCKGKNFVNVFQGKYFDKKIISDAFDNNKVIQHTASNKKVMAIPIEVNKIRHVLTISSPPIKKIQYQVKSDYQQMKISDVMTKNIVTLPHSALLVKASEVMGVKHISSIVVTKNGNVAGILTERDIVKLISQSDNISDIKIGEVMSKPIIAINYDKDIAYAGSKLAEHKIRRLVVKKGKKLVGIVTETDILRGVISEDISLKEEQKKVAEQLLRLKLGIERSKEAIFLTDDKGNISYVNPAFMKLYRYSREEVLGKNLCILKSRLHDCEYKRIWKEIQSKKSVEFELINQTKDGRLLNIEASINPILDENKTLKGFLAIQRDITQRREIENEMKKAKAYSESVIKSMSDALWVIDLDGKTKDVNPAAVLLYGYKNRKELIKKNPTDVTSKKDLEKVIKLIKDVLKSGYSSGDAHIVRKDRKEIPVSIKCSLMKDPQGKVTGAFSVIRDISDKKKAEEKLKESEESFRSMFEGSADAVFIADSMTRQLVDCNKKAEQLTGYTKKEILGMRAYQLHPPDVVKRTMVDFEKHAAGELMLVESEVLTKDGRRIPVGINSNLIQIKGRKLVQGIFRDVSERKQAEEKLKESEKRFKQFFDNNRDYCYMISPAGKILDANISSCKVLGYSRDEIIGKPLLTTVYAPSSRGKAKELFMKWKKTGKLVDEELNIISKSSKERTVLISVDSVSDNKGNLLHSISVQRDITEHKKAEKESKESEEKYRTLVDNIPQKIFLKDINSVYISCNENYAKDLKIKPEEIAGRTDYEFYPKELAGKYRGDDKRLMKAGKIEDIEEEYIQDGKKVFVHTVKTPVRDEKGNIIGILGIFWDITERKKAEEDRKKLTYELQQRISELERFQNLTIGREIKMIELKKKIKELEEK